MRFRGVYELTERDIKEALAAYIAQRHDSGDVIPEIQFRRDDEDRVLALIVMEVSNL